MKTEDIVFYAINITYLFFHFVDTPVFGAIDPIFFGRESETFILYFLLGKLLFISVVLVNIFSLYRMITKKGKIPLDIYIAFNVLIIYTRFLL